MDLIKQQQQLHCNPGWAVYVRDMAGKLLNGLGIASGAIIHPELYKLLLLQDEWQPYDCGHANLPDRTVATMIIVLPSQHEVCHMSQS